MSAKDKNFKTRQQKKSEALNAIRQIYHPKYEFPYHSNFFEEDDGSFAEQREYRVRSIIEQLERDLTALKKAAKKSIKMLKQNEKQQPTKKEAIDDNIVLADELYLLVKNWTGGVSGNTYAEFELLRAKDESNVKRYIEKEGYSVGKTEIIKVKDIRGY